MDDGRHPNRTDRGGLFRRTCADGRCPGIFPAPTRPSCDSELAGLAKWTFDVKADVPQRETLTDRQTIVLRWIGDDCPVGVMEGNSCRISAAALRNLGLVKISGRGPTWSAVITDAGRGYLEQVDGPTPPLSREGNGSVTEQLVNDVIAAGGSLRVPRRSYGVKGVDYERRARLAERNGRVPAGKRLTVTCLPHAELQIDLVDAPEGTTLDLRPVPVPHHVSRYHAVVGAFRNRSDRHEVSRSVLPRVSRILQGLVLEAERRGYDVAIGAAGAEDGYRRPARPTNGQPSVLITVGGYSAAVEVSEEGMPSLAYWEQQNRSYTYPFSAAVNRLPPRSKYDAHGTGRLTLAIRSAHTGSERPTRWSDRKSWTVEEKLPELLREIEVRSAEHRHRLLEAARQAAERQRAWEAAIEVARERHAEQHRVEALRDEVDRWHQAERIRAYCNAAASAYYDSADTAAWLEWAGRYTDGIDPLRLAPQAPAPLQRVAPEELQPYLEGWDPYGPTRRGYR